MTLMIRHKFKIHPRVQKSAPPLTRTPDVGGREQEASLCTHGHAVEYQGGALEALIPERPRA